MKRIIYMGTPDFAVDSLQALYDDDRYEVVAVVSQPDRPVGRKGTLTPPPVKEKALELGLPVLQPEQIKDPEAIREIQDYQPDLIVTAAYGQILPKDLLDLPEYGAINVHASLLPRFRGAAPIHYALLEGDSETGVTIMYMVEELDAGDMLAVDRIPIDDQDDMGQLFEKLAQVGANLLIDTLPDLFSGSIQRKAQDEALVTYAPAISKADEAIDWQAPASSIVNKIKALSPEPGSFTWINGDRFKVWSAELADISNDGLAAGTVVKKEKKQFYVAAGDGGVVKVKEVQPSGKKRMPAASFLNGAGQFIEKGFTFDEPDNQ